jgi:hypothetical protein
LADTNYGRKENGIIRTPNMVFIPSKIKLTKCEECKKEMIDALKLIAAGKRKLEEVVKNGEV